MFNLNENELKLRAMAAKNYEILLRSDFLP